MERLKGTLWVDLAGLGSLAEEGKEALRRELRDALREGGSAREVRVLLRSPELLCDDPVFVYESFSEAADLARRRRLGLTYLFLTGDRDEDGRRVFLFLVDARAGGGPEPGTVCEFDGELDFWDPDSFRRKCAGTLAARLFIDVGSRQDSALPEPLRPWQADPRTAFAGLSRRWREGFVERLRAHFLPEEGVLRRAARWVAFRWRFGAGRNEGFSRREGSLARRLHATEGGNLFERLRAPDARAGPDPLPHPLSPPFPFLQEIEAVEAVLPDYFHPELPRLGELEPVAWEAAAAEAALPTAFLAESLPALAGEVAGWRARLAELAGRLGPVETPPPPAAPAEAAAGAPPAETPVEAPAAVPPAVPQEPPQLLTPAEYRAAKAALLRELVPALRRLRDRLDRAVEAELAAVLGLENLCELHPDRFRSAYRRVFEQGLGPVLRLLNSLWGLRSFLTVELPQWVPSVVYPLQAPVRHGVVLVRRLAGLLHFYQAACLVLLDHRDAVNAFHAKVAELLWRVPGFGAHTANVLAEVRADAARAKPPRGKEHADNLREMSTLAEIHKARGDLPAARELQEWLVEARRRVFGGEHPHTHTSMSNLASTLKAQGSLAGARVLEERVARASDVGVRKASVVDD